jgi:hypothetical protein
MSRRRILTATTLAALAGLALTGCGDESKASVGQQPLGGTPEATLASPGAPLPSVTPPSPEPTSGVQGDLPAADRPAAGPTPCPTNQQIVDAYRKHLSELGVMPAAYAVGKRSPCASGWAASTLREGSGPPFVVVVGPNIRGKALSVVADGTDRDKGEPCGVAARSGAPEAIVGFCRSA